MSQSFFEHFRCPDNATRFYVDRELSGRPGYFRFGEDIICFGTTSAVAVASQVDGRIGDISSKVCLHDRSIGLPFDPDEVVDNLRYERYVGKMDDDATRLGAHPFIRALYYLCRPFLPLPIRSFLQRIRLRGELENPFPHWPVDRTVDHLYEKLMELAIQAGGNAPIPFIWFWPDGAKAALILTHDVESKAGAEFCSELMALDSEFGFRSSFQIVPEKRYKVTAQFLQNIKDLGFEVNVHDLNHDGNLFRERGEFLRRAGKINQYALKFGTTGFRSGALYRNVRWFDAFKITYDMSVPNVGHLDPQNGGCCTVMPYFIGDVLEIPVTETQDYSLFHILNQYSIDLWRRQTEIILRGNGIINLITHPDYLMERKAQYIYRQLLGYLAEIRSSEGIWATLPAEIDRWWRMRRAMKLVRAGEGWQIEGEGRERAKIAYACLVDGRVQYIFDTPSLNSQESPALGSRDESGIEGEALIEKALPSVYREQGSSGAPSNDWTVQTAIIERQTRNGSPHALGTLGVLTFPSEGAAVDTPSVKQQETTIAEPKNDSQRTHEDQRPLRICMVAYTFYESDNRVMRYAETLAQLGHQVEVFALQHGSAPREEILCGVKVHRLQSRRVNEKSRFSYFVRILSFLSKSMYHVSKNDLKQKYDLLHVHSVPDFLVFSAILPRLGGRPIILDIHDILPEFYTSKFGTKHGSLIFRLLHFTEWISAKFSSHVIIANHIWQERLCSRSVKPDKCTVVLNSPDRSIFHRLKERPASRERFQIVYPGTLNWHQGLDIAIRAFAKISEQVPFADFHIYGEGPTKNNLALLIKDLNLENRILLHAPKSLRDIARVIESADLGIVPKRKDNFGNEAFSTKILEFMAMGVPVIVSDTRIDRYYFDDSIVRFFRGGDEIDLGRCMLDLIQHPEKRRTLIENATAFVAHNDWTIKKHEYLDLVDKLTHRPVA
ncbi:MAG TPA: glycosyltransferase [Candidatus Dormibacteraeota bacterium]|nr:glycosyltransferase [Candidatus Dormibacteraeota bacterium]